MEEFYRGFSTPQHAEYHVNTSCRVVSSSHHASKHEL